MDLNKELEHAFSNLELFIRVSGKIIILMDKAFYSQEMENFWSVNLIMEVQLVLEKGMALEKILEKSKFYLLMDLFTMDSGQIIKETELEYKYILMEINMMVFGWMTKDKVEVNLQSLIKIMKKEFRANLLVNFIMIQQRDL